jgi:hypothetical protein
LITGHFAGAIKFDLVFSFRNAKNITNPRQYITKKIDTMLNPSAFELTNNDKTYVFVILRHLRNIRDNDLWISSYNSIRKFYTNKIVIIDDNSSINTVDGKLVNAEVIRSEFNGAGEILPYYYFLKYKWADKMIFLHDSMFINRLFTQDELEGDVKFHWHFEKGYITDLGKLVIFPYPSALGAFVGYKLSSYLLTLI